MQYRAHYVLRCVNQMDRTQFKFLATWNSRARQGHSVVWRISLWLPCYHLGCFTSGGSAIYAHLRDSVGPRAPLQSPLECERRKLAVTFL